MPWSAMHIQSEGIMSLLEPPALTSTSRSTSLQCICSAFTNIIPQNYAAVGARVSGATLQAGSLEDEALMLVS